MYLLSGEPAPHCRIVANVAYPRRQDADPARPLDFAWPQPESEPEPTYGRGHQVFSRNGGWRQRWLKTAGRSAESFTKRQSLPASCSSQKSCLVLLVETPWTSHAHPPVSQSTASLTAKRRGRGGFRFATWSTWPLAKCASTAGTRPAGNETTALSYADLQKPMKSGRRLLPGSHFRSLHSGLLMRVGALHDSFAHGPEVLAALAEPDAPHSRKSCMCLSQQRIDTTSHWCSHYTPGMPFVEYSVTLAVLDFFCAGKRWTPLKHPWDGKMNVSLFIQMSMHWQRQQRLEDRG